MVMNSRAIAMSAEDPKAEFNALYERRLRGRVGKGSTRGTNRFDRLDAEMAARGTSGNQRSRKVVGMFDGTAALKIDERQFTISEDLHRAMRVAVKPEDQYEFDGHTTPEYRAGNELLIDFNGDHHAVETSNPYRIYQNDARVNPATDRWLYRVTFVEIPSLPFLTMTQAQLRAVVIPTLTIVPKPVFALTDSLAFYGRWMAGLATCAKSAFAKQADNVETVTHTPCIGCDDMPMIFIAAGEVIERICSVCGE